MLRSQPEPISWQQEGRLRRDVARAERVPNVVTLVPLPDDVSAEEVLTRLRSVVEREEALRVVSIDLDDDGGRQHYAPSLHVSLPSVVLDPQDAEAMDAFVEAETYRYFARLDGPLWRGHLVHHRDPLRGPTRSVCLTFDHLVTDGRSQTLIVDQLLHPGVADYSGGRHSVWVREQRALFGSVAVPNETGTEFWRRHLDGGPPDRAADLSFCADKDGPLSGQALVRRHVSPVGATTLRRVAAQSRSTPFAVLMGAISNAVFEHGGSNDVTYRINVSGRSPEYIDTHGFFTENMPLRIADPHLGDPAAAAAAARSAWLDTLPHQSTPWDHLLATCPCGQDHLQARPAQILVNFSPWLEMSHGEPPPTSTLTYVARVGTFQIGGSMWDDDTLRIECQFDPGRFEPDGVAQFLGTLDAALVALAEPS